MALRPLEISAKQKKRNTLQAQVRRLTERRRQLRADEAALQAEIDNAEEVTDELEQRVEELAQQLEQVDTEIADTQDQIAQIDEELAGEEPADGGAPAARSRGGVPAAGRAAPESGNFVSRSRCFRSRSARDAFYGQDAVKTWLQNVRTLAGSGRRSVKGAELGIPDQVLDLVRDNLGEHSKLIGKVRLRSVSGTSRANVVGKIPEGVWTEMCATLSELEFAFTQIEMDGYKVGGFISLCNAQLEDSDINLGEEIVDMLLRAIGLALDKAIVYGKGPNSKMPVGFVTRLAQTEEPAYWGANEGDWTNLSAAGETPHVLQLDLAATEGVKFFRPLLGALGTAEPAYSNGKSFWVMNRKTHMDLMARGLSFNAAGALVAGLGNAMPVENGEIVELEFMPDYEIAGGFGDVYLLVERQGGTVARSEHARFIEDQTVIKATARYDGKPIRGEGFVLVNYANVAPTTAVEFGI